MRLPYKKKNSSKRKNKKRPGDYFAFICSKSIYSTPPKLKCTQKKSTTHWVLNSDKHNPGPGEDTKTIKQKIKIQKVISVFFDYRYLHHHWRCCYCRRRHRREEKDRDAQHP